MKKTIYKLIAVSSASLFLLSGCGAGGERERSVDEIEQVETDTGEEMESGEEAKELPFGVGAEAPDFRLFSLEGDAYRFEEPRGKAVLLNFFGVNCPYCRDGMDDLNKLYGEVREDAEVLLVNVGDSRESLEKFKTEYNLDAPILLDEDYSVGRSYMMQYVPYTVVIDVDGKISMIKVGPMSYEEMEKELDIASKK